MQYHFRSIEAKWQEYWKKHQSFKAENQSKKPKFYVLDMFPYPSGAGLHVGHPLGYIASDIYARYKRLKGFNVLHPMGYDSFGLPAEQYAIQTGQHPAITTKTNIQRYRQQLDRIGFSFDWSREVRTSNPSYYRWTQWIFMQLFDSWYDNKQQKARPIASLVQELEQNGNLKVDASCDEDTPKISSETWNNFSEEAKLKFLLKYRLTYLAETEVNWCPALGTVLANDEIVNGVSERGGHPVERKKMKQWSMRITAYAQRLLEYLNELDWTNALKESQTNWIGRSDGAMVCFKLQHADDNIWTFTTRPDTIFGVSFMVLAPEHELVPQITTDEQRPAVEAYQAETAKRSERERMADVKSISGVFTGAYALHPFTNKLIPIWIGDYVLAGYGTGAVMAVPCGDERDYAFAKHFNLDIPNIFNQSIEENAFSDKSGFKLIHSDFLNDLNYESGKKAAIKALEEQQKGYEKVNYRLRDAVFSRQRYWGEPFPVYYVNDIPHLIPEDCLPLELPEVEKYLPTEDGQPPLGRAQNWAWNTRTKTVVSVDEIDNKTIFPLELNTMPGWAGSSWYFFRYMDAQNNEEFAAKEALDYWKNVDLYIGGSEHATGHLLYARFWTKFLYDRGWSPVNEPFKKLINQGMILGESAFVFRKKNTNSLVTASKADFENDIKIHADVSLINANNKLDVEAFKVWRPEFENAEVITEDNGDFLVLREVEKMSKSKYNVVNPDEICEQYGADTLRMYEMFLGPLEQAKPWNTAGITGVHSFLKKFWKLFFNEKGQLTITEEPASKQALKVLHKTIKKIEDDLQEFSFNTTISAFMIAVNELTSLKCTQREVLEPFVVMLSPFAPHICEELWERLGHQNGISTADFPEFNSSYLVEDTKDYPVSFNGKMRFTITLPLDLEKSAIEKAVMEHPKTFQYLEGKSPKKVIVVPGKIVNLVC